MSSEARLSSASQTINGMTTRAYYLAISDMAMTAIRFVPGQWAAEPDDREADVSDRQFMVAYRYVGTTVREESNGDFVVEFGEHFRAVDEIKPMRMPSGVWAAPLESLDDSLDGYLSEIALEGNIGEFELDAEANPSFFNADDFLIVIDPQTGVQQGLPQPFQMWAYSPDHGYELDKDGDAYQRFNFSGVVTYQREAMTALGSSADASDRQALLQDVGRPFMVHRFSGGLLSGARVQEDGQ